MTRVRLVRAALSALLFGMGMVAVTNGCGGAGFDDDHEGGVRVSVSPKTANLAPAATQQFTATVSGSGDSDVSWTVDESNGGTVSTAGLYTAPATAGTFHVRATSQTSPSASDTAVVTVSGGSGGVTVTISPKTANLAPTATQQFTATVTGSANTLVSWTVDEPGGGSVTVDGLYSAPAAGGTYHVRATSQASPSASDAATVIVSGGGGGGPALSLSIDPTLVEAGSTKAGSLSKVELLDTAGTVLKIATISAGTASIDMTGLSGGNYFLRVNDLADDLVPTKIDNPGVPLVQAVGPKLRLTRVGPPSDPTYRMLSFSRGQGSKNVVKYSDGSSAAPQSYAYALLYLKTSAMKIETRTLGTAALLVSYTNGGPHPFASWTLSGGSAKPHGDPTVYTSDRACSCHGDLNSKPASFSSIRESNGWCYKCHYGKTGPLNGFVHPGQ